MYRHMHERGKVVTHESATGGGSHIDRMLGTQNVIAGLVRIGVEKAGLDVKSDHRILMCELAIPVMAQVHRTQQGLSNKIHKHIWLSGAAGDEIVDEKQPKMKRLDKAQKEEYRKEMEEKGEALRQLIGRLQLCTTIEELDEIELEFQSICKHGAKEANGWTSNVKGKGLSKPTQQEIDDTLVTDAHNHLLRTMKKLTWMLKDKRNGDVDEAMQTMARSLADEATRKLLIGLQEVGEKKEWKYGRFRKE